MNDRNEIYDFYNNGAEIGRLERGLGKVEFYRTTEIFAQYLPLDRSDCRKVIYDVGGGIGRYSRWLASYGHEVHLLELAENAVKYAKEHLMKDWITFTAETADARHLPRPDNSADVVLLMGPLYHMQKEEDRAAALREARRVLKDGGLLMTAGISKYSSTTWALSVYGRDNDYIDDPIFFDMLRGELTTGHHNRPKEYPYLIAESYFATPYSFADEMEHAGFTVINSHAVEGCIWFTPHLEEKWENAESRKRLLEIVHLTEHDREMMGMSPHFIVVGRK